ncbi:MAG: hypothetical protein JST00_46260 [Deltaproteobacteria bacterium]|nr:hypothetical protein [Deltaproteobacteria bacterium]
MPYREAPIVLPRLGPDLARPARLLGAAALAFVAVQLVNTFGLPDDLRMRWLRSGSAMAHAFYWLGFACRAAIVPGAVLYGLRADERRVRRLALAGAALLALGLATSLWSVLFASRVLEVDTSRPYWAPPKAIVPLREVLTTASFAIGVTSLGWALARRDARTLATVITVFAFGTVFYHAMYALEVPWAQLLTPDARAARLAVRITNVSFVAPTFALGLAGIARARSAPLAPPSRSASPEPPIATRSAPPAYEAFASLPAGVVAATAPLALLGVADLWMTLARGPRDFDNWMSAAGIVRLEYFETMTYAPYGALVLASAFLVHAAWRAGRSGVAAFAGLASTALAIATVTLFMRGRWKIRISTETDFSHVQVLVAVAAAFVLATGGAALAHGLRSSAGALAAAEAADLAEPLAKVVRAVSARSAAASVLAAVGFLAIAFGDVSRSTATHELLAVGGGLVTIAGAGFAASAAWVHARGRALLAEAIERATADGSAVSEPPTP